jgi:hypothetical protein
MLKVLLDHTRLAQNDLRIRAELYFSKMNKNPKYEIFQPLVSLLGVLIVDYTAALLAADDGGATVIKNKNKLKDDLNLFLSKLGKKIESEANDLPTDAGEQFVLDSGYSLGQNNTRKTLSYLDVPTNFTVINDPQRKGALLLKWNRTTGATMYAVDVLDKDGNWQNVALHSLVNLTLTGYEPDEKVTFRLKAVGANSLTSDYTEPMSIRVRL